LNLLFFYFSYITTKGILKADKPVLVRKIHSFEISPAIRALFSTTAVVVYDRMAGNHRCSVDEVFWYVCFLFFDFWLVNFMLVMENHGLPKC